MQTGIFRAVRADLTDLAFERNAPAFAGAPERLFVPSVPEARASRLRRQVPSTLVSVAVHAALALGFVVLWHSMVSDLTSREPISVEIVHSIPGEDKSVQKPGPKEPLPVQPAPAAQNPLPPPAAPPQAPTATPTPAPEEPLRPALVEPPPEPKAAVTQADKNEKANRSEDHEKRQAAAAPTAPAPEVLASSEAASAVPLPSRAPEPPALPQPAETKGPARPQPPVSLEAALPMNPLAMPATFRAVLSAAGSSDSQEYKGVIYGMLGRGHAREIAREAERRGLRGQVIVALTVDDTGAIATVSVMQSSGRPNVDAMALDLVRSAAPFPPPPPGTQRLFTPAIAFGG